MTTTRDDIEGFDFGFLRSIWTSATTYLAEPTPGKGVIVYKIPGWTHVLSVGWCISFFPVTDPNKKLIDEYAEFTVARARKESLDKITHYGSIQDVLTITSIIHNHTIGE